MADRGSRRVVVTGIGPVSCIGVGVDRCWDALLAGRRGVAARTLPLDVGRAVELPVAGMDTADSVVASKAAFLADNEYANYRDLAYALAGIELALQDADFQYDREDNDIGVVQVFEAPGMERAVFGLLRTCEEALSTGAAAGVYEQLAPLFYRNQSFLYVHAVGKAFGFHGFSTATHNACSSGGYAVEVAAQHIRSGQADAMVVAGGEAFETAVRIEWFRQMDLYATDLNCKPFNANSSGFYVGEGGCALLLECESAARARGACPYAEYVGGAFEQQGWKHALPDVRADRLTSVIRRALLICETEPGDIDLVIPHGAGTSINDGYEAACLDRALGTAATRAHAIALKPHFGHLLASSGLMELAAGLLAMRHGHLPATLNSDGSSASLPMPLVTENTSFDVRTLLKVSTGFTGHDTAAIFRAV